MLRKLKNKAADFLFPAFCLNCKKEGSYLCQDCEAMLDILQYHKRHSNPWIDDLYFALPWQKKLVKVLMGKFKNPPYIKDAAGTLAALIAHHLQLLEEKPDLADFVLTFVPISLKDLKIRGFNHAEEIAKSLSLLLNIPVQGFLEKTRITLPQCSLPQGQRKENVENAFSSGCVQNKNIILVDDVYSSGCTMNECAKALKKAGAKKIVGMVVARE